MERAHVLVNRRDGLGERLRAIVNGLYLANHLGLEFKFVWPSKSFAREFHVIEEPKDIFAEAFLKNHLLRNPPKDFSNYLTVSNTNRIEQNVGLAELLQDQRGIYFDDLDVRRVFNQRSGTSFNKLLAKTANTIEFSEPIKLVRARVKALNLAKTSVAVHIRGGDIVYGPYRFFQHFQDKALPLPIAKKILTDLLSQGLEPIVFAQDEAVKMTMRDIIGVKLADDFVDTSYSKIEKAFFDIFLMANCAQIYAGSSGFAELAALLAGKTVKRPDLELKEKYKVKIIKKDLETTSYDDLQMAYGWFNYVLYGETFLAWDKIDKALKKAQVFDSENQLYTVKRVTNYLVNDMSKKAERLLEEIVESSSHLDNPLDAEFFKILTKKHGHKFGLRKYFPAIFAVKKLSRPYLLLCRAYIYYLSQKFVGCEKILQKFESIEKYGLGFQKSYQLLSNKVRLEQQKEPQ